MNSASNPDFAQMRKAMVASQLRPDSVSDLRVVKAFAEVPRDAFVPDEAKALAYADAAVPLGGGRAMNPPIATARLINEAGVSPSDHVLLIGAGRGYAAAVLAELAGSVVALEEDEALAKAAKAALSGLANVSLVLGPLGAGWSKKGPYDLILIDGAVEECPAAFTKQLAPNGRIAAAILSNGISRLSIGRASGDVVRFLAFADSAAAVLPGFVRPPEFTF